MSRLIRFPSYDGSFYGVWVKERVPPASPVVSAGMTGYYYNPETLAMEYNVPLDIR